MPKFNSMKDLIAFLHTEIRDSLKTDVADDAVETMKERIGNVDDVGTDTVYGRHLPTQYERTGKLADSCVAYSVDADSVELTNTRTDEKSGRYIPTVIESGKGYYNLELDAKIGARPFVAETAEELKNGRLKKSMKKSLEGKFGKGSVI